MMIAGVLSAQQEFLDLGSFMSISNKNTATDAFRFKVYPNFSNNFVLSDLADESNIKDLTIDYSDKKAKVEKIVRPTDVYIVDMSGKAVWKGDSYVMKDAKIDVSYLPSGYYFVCYYDQNGYATKRFVKN